MHEVRDLLFEGLREHLGDSFEVNPRRVGSGGTCRVYAALSRTKGVSVAVKVFREPVNRMDWLVKREREVSLALSEADGASEGEGSSIVVSETTGSFGQAQAAVAFDTAPCGIPKFYDFDVFSHPTTGEQHAYIMLQLLGPSLHELIDDCVVTRSNFVPVHCDVKPGNFCVGRPGSSRIFAIDLGGAMRMPETLEEANEQIIFFGTPDYASKTGLQCTRCSYRDDLESLCYSLFEMWTGERPWKIQEETRFRPGTNGYTETQLNGIMTARDELWTGLCAHRSSVPAFLQTWRQYVLSLQPLDIPNYGVLRELLLDSTREAGEEKLAWQAEEFSSVPGAACSWLAALSYTAPAPPREAANHHTQRQVNKTPPVAAACEASGAEAPRLARAPRNKRMRPTSPDTCLYGSNDAAARDLVAKRLCNDCFAAALAPEE